MNCLSYGASEFTPGFQSLFVLFRLAIALSVLLRFTASDYCFGLQLLITALVSSNFSFGCIDIN
jgi:hypothetical protein